MKLSILRFFPNQNIKNHFPKIPLILKYISTSVRYPPSWLLINVFEFLLFFEHDHKKSFLNDGILLLMCFTRLITIGRNTFYRSILINYLSFLFKYLANMYWQVLMISFPQTFYQYAVAWKWEFRKEFNPLRIANLLCHARVPEFSLGWEVCVSIFKMPNKQPFIVDYY